MENTPRDGEAAHAALLPCNSDIRHCDAQCAIRRMSPVQFKYLTAAFHPSLPGVPWELCPDIPIQHASCLAVSRLTVISFLPSSFTDTNLEADDSLRNTPALLVLVIDFL